MTHGHIDSIKRSRFFLPTVILLALAASFAFGIKPDLVAGSGVVQFIPIK